MLLAIVTNKTTITVPHFIRFTATKQLTEKRKQTATFSADELGVGDVLHLRDGTDHHTIKSVNLDVAAP